MKLMKTLLAATALTALMAGGAYAKQLIYCSENSPKHFDPAMATGGNDFDASARTIFNRLVEFKHGETAIEPGLADSWEISDDGLEYTFHLHPGTKFHTTSYFTPTRDLNADDVVFSFERQYKADNPYNAYLQDSQYEYYLAMAMPDYIDSVEKVDDLTVKIKLKSPNSPMIANLGMDFASIVSKEYADKLLEAGTPELFAQQPVGTGPFQFVDYQLDSVIRYAAFPDYFKGKVKIDDLIFAITPDTTARTQRLLAGECDIMPYPNPQDIESLQANENLTVLSQAGLNIGYMSYNTTVAPTNDVEVRKALSMAINKTALVEALFGKGNAETAKNLIPPTMWSYNTNTPEHEYNPDKAREILAAKGVTELDIWAAPDIPRSYNPSFVRSAEIIQQDWAAVGVKANIHTVEWAQYRVDGAAADRQGAFQIGWGGDNGDPDNFFSVLFGASAIGTQNYSIWNNEEFEALIKEGVRETDQAKRTAIYEKAQEVMTREEPAFLMAHSTIYMPMNKKVIGYTMDPLAMHRFDNVDVAE